MLWVQRHEDRDLNKSQLSSLNGETWKIQIWLAPPASALWGERQFTALLDTGSTVPIVVSKKIAAKLGIKSGYQERVPLVAGQTINASNGQLDVRIGDLALIQVPCLIMDDSPDSGDLQVIVGAPLLQLFRITIDDTGATFFPNPEAIGRRLKAWDQNRSDRSRSFSYEAFEKRSS